MNDFNGDFQKMLEQRSLQNYYFEPLLNYLLVSEVVTKCKNPHLTTPHCLSLPLTTRVLLLLYVPQSE